MYITMKIFKEGKSKSLYKARKLTSIRTLLKRIRRVQNTGSRIIRDETVEESREAIYYEGSEGSKVLRIESGDILKMTKQDSKREDHEAEVNYCFVVRDVM